MEVQGKQNQENGPKAEKNKTETATGLGRRTKEEIYIYREKWDQTESPHSPDRGRHHKSPASIWGITIGKHYKTSHTLAGLGWRCSRAAAAVHR